MRLLRQGFSLSILAVYSLPGNDGIFAGRHHY
jgi:hypothetical protein